MMRADSSFGAKRFQRDRLFIVFVDCVTYAAHQIELRIVSRGAAWMATPTSAKAGLLGSFGYLEEAHLFASRPPRRA